MQIRLETTPESMSIETPKPLSIQYIKTDLAYLPEMKEQIILQNDSDLPIFGDLHGNFMRFIRQLIDLDFLSISSAEYDELGEIYFKDVHEITADELNKIKMILEKASPGEAAKINASIFLGDILAERGRNDYFNLLLFSC